ncbi:hypothetical protein M0R45_014955 [Rubus argutus]|uniref:Uncharacterized protein n=1 Tax=Rubus argutus TaxID=59490 RepID=A0AAW1XN13_RUBAR
MEAATANGRARDRRQNWRSCWAGLGPAAMVWLNWLKHGFDLSEAMDWVWFRDGGVRKIEHNCNCSGVMVL